MTIIFKTDRTIIAESRTLTFVELVEQNKKNLVKADLRGANLSGADLRGADLSRAYLDGTNLSGANLSGADLWGAYLDGANLSGANLEGAVLEDANLRWANLEGSNLEGAELKWAMLRGATLAVAKGFFQVEEGLLQKVAQAALASEDSLEMNTWHKCDTPHYIAGWACFLAQNKELEAKYGTAVAAQMLLGLTDISIFYALKEEAKEWLKQYL
jgi:hypothetical protein